MPRNSLLCFYIGKTMFALGILTVFALFAETMLTEGSRHCSHKRHDLFIVVDGSENVGTNEFKRVRKFLQHFVARLDVGLGKNHVGLLLVDHKDRTKIEISLGQHDTGSALSKAIGEIKHHRRRRSDMAYALKLVQNKVFTDKHGDKHGAKANDVLIIFTNRIRATELEDVLKRAHELKQRNVEIITVYVKNTKMTWNVKDELTAMSTIPENVLTLQSNRKLRMTLKRRICPSARAMHPTKGCVRKNHDVFFVLDGSGSISLPYFEKMKYFLINLIEQLDVDPQGTHVGLLQFSHSLKTRIEFNLGEHQTFKKVKDAIVRMKYQEGGTDTGDALEIVNNQVFNRTVPYRRNVSDIVVILTDGEAIDRKKALKEAKKLRLKGVQIIAIGMGEEETVATFRNDLKLMASKSSDVFTADFKKLPYLVKTLTSEICYARPPKAMKCSRQKRDILMVVDGSASVGHVNIKKVKKFLQKLVLELHVGKHRNHVALVQYSEALKTYTQFGFDYYYDPKKIGRSINRMAYYAGKKTRTGYALALANQMIFTGRRGDRPKASDVIILVADGGAHDEAAALINAARLKQRGVQIVTVYIPDSRNDRESREFLLKVASSPNDFYTSNFDELKYIAADLVKVVCSNK